MSTLKFPAFLYGPPVEVRAAVRHYATLILKENSLQPVLKAPQIEVAAYPGKILLSIDDRISISESNFHAYAIWWELSKRVLRQPIEKDAYVRLSSLAHMGLAQPWWFAGLLISERYNIIVERAAQQLQFLNHARAHWSTLLSVGSRYSPYAQLETIPVPTLVLYCLIRQGSPILKPPFPPLTTERLNNLLDHLPGYQVRRLAKDSPTDVAPFFQGLQEVQILSLAEHLLDFGHHSLACELVRGQNHPDPHKIIDRWLAR